MELESIVSAVADIVDAGDGLPLTVPTLLHERATRRLDKPLLICDDDVLTYADALSRSATLAKGLLAAGASRGTHVGLLHPNGSAFVVGWLAAARIGAVAVPLSTFSTSTELRTLLRSADIAFVNPSLGPGRFPDDQVFELPGLLQNLKEGVKLYEELLKANLLRSDLRTRSSWPVCISHTVTVLS